MRHAEYKPIQIKISLYFKKDKRTEQITMLWPVFIELNTGCKKDVKGRM